jgi:hypothetical protein
MTGFSIFLVALLTGPVVLSWQLLSAACMLLSTIAFLVAYCVALVHARAGKSWRELLVTTTRVRISWIWGWTAACVGLVLYVSTLAYLERVASWFAALPYLISAVLTLVVAAWMRHSVRAKVVRMQKIVQGGRP